MKNLTNVLINQKLKIVRKNLIFKTSVPKARKLKTNNFVLILEQFLERYNLSAEFSPELVLLTDQFSLAKSQTEPNLTRLELIN